MRSNRLLYIMVAFYLVFLGGASYYTLFFPIRVTHHILMTILLGGWLLHRWRKNGLPSTPLNRMIFVTIGIWGLSAILSWYPRYSFEALWFGIIHVVLFFVITDLIQRGYQRLVMDTVFIMASMTVFISVLEFSSWYFGLGILPNTSIGWIAGGRWIPSLSEIPNASLAMSISTLLAGFVAPLILMAFVWGSTTVNKGYRNVLWGLAALLGFVLLLTSSRGGGISVMVSFGVFTLIQLSRNEQITRRIPTRGIVGAGLIAVAIGLAGFVYLTFPQGQGLSNAGRLDMWQSALRIGADHPLLGTGYGMFGRAFREYRDPSIVQDKLASAHNILLNTFAELGVIGVICLLGISVLALRAMWHTWKATPTRPQKIRREAAFSVLMGIAAHSMVDVFTTTPVVLVVLAYLAYAITPLPLSKLTPQLKGQRLPAIVLCIMIVTFGIWRVLILDRAQGSYIASFSAFTIQEALEQTQIASSQDPTMRLYDLQATYLLGLEGHPDAISAFENSLQNEPTWDTGWQWLAFLYEQEGQLDEAFIAIDRAYRINHRNGSATHWARLAEELDNPDKEGIVLRYYTGIRDQYDIYRTLPTSTFWMQTPLRQEALTQFFSTAPLDWQYRLREVHNPEGLASLIPDTPQKYAEWWVVGQFALTQEENPQKAVEAFTRALEVMPYPSAHRGDYYISRARASRETSPTEADRDLELARLYQPLIESLETNPDAPRPSRRVNEQEFAAVMFGRPSPIQLPVAYRLPQ